MLISVLVCKPDGTQVLEEREVPEDYFHVEGESSSAEDLNRSET